MKFSKISSLTSLLLAALSEAAPQYVADSGPANPGTPDGPTLEDAVNQVFAAENRAPVRRDAPSLEEAVDRIFAAEHVDLRRRDDVPSLPAEVEDISGDNKWELASHWADFACITDGKKVNPAWVWDQTENKVDYIFRPNAQYGSVSIKYKNAMAGMDWNGRQNGTDNTWAGDWVTFELAWDRIRGDKPMTSRLAKQITMAGLMKCATKYDEGLRTMGFSARWADEFAFWFKVINIDDKTAEKTAGDKKDYFWQAPMQADWNGWSQFLDWNKNNNIATPYGVDPTASLPNHDELRI